MILFALAVQIAGSLVTIEPAPLPAEAVVIFSNHPTNTNLDNQEYVLNLNELTVPFTFRYNSGMAGMDSIVVTPPDGMICEPLNCTAEVLEGFVGRVFLIPWSGM